MKKKKRKLDALDFEPLMPDCEPGAKGWPVMLLDPPMSVLVDGAIC